MSLHPDSDPPAPGDRQLMFPDIREHRSSPPAVPRCQAAPWWVRTSPAGKPGSPARHALMRGDTPVASGTGACAARALAAQAAFFNSITTTPHTQPQ